jgi:CheY-like chemotaxis protein/anti-sigma regulatory factor (Ser/Thr protein kinase)
MGEKHHLTVCLRPPAAPLPPLADDLSVLLYQAVRELLLNTVKYAQVAAAVVTLAHQEHTLTLTVADAGVGFDPTRLRVVGGVEGGFGLLGIRERLGLLGGHLEIESRPGQGSRFRLVAPLRPVAEETPIVRPLAIPAAAPSGVALGRRTRVLVVDDDALVRRGFAALLTGEPDLEVVGEAADGKMAIELTRNLAPDVILMDISMAVMNGIEATRAIHAEFPAARVIGRALGRLGGGGGVGLPEQERLRRDPTRGNSGRRCPYDVSAEALVPQSDLCFQHALFLSIGSRQCRRAPLPHHRYGVCPTRR